MTNNSWSSLPQDPFEGDPNDPSFLLEPDDEFVPLTQIEKMEVTEDLMAVRTFRTELEPEGIKGICMMCEDCSEMHYYNWDVLESHYADLLDGVPSPVHEPQFDPNPLHYAPWEYCAGYVDGKRNRRRKFYKNVR